MQPHSFTPHLFHLRRTVNAAIKTLRDCSIAERKLRLQAVQCENGETIDPVVLASARARAFVMRWHAQDVIVKAGSALLVMCVVMDKTLTTAEKLDLLGAGHRCWTLPEFVEFGRLVGDGWEAAPMDCCGAADPRMGPLKACGLAMLDPAFLEQHAALQPVVEAIERADMRARDVASEWAYAASRVAAAGALAMPDASLLQ